MTSERPVVPQYRQSLSRSLVRAVTPLLRRFDIRVSRWSKSYAFQRIRYLRDTQVSALIDVGANEGQYGAELRGDGYRGRLLSVEPLDSAMLRLRERCAGDPLWECVQCAAGSTGGRGTLGVSDNSYSSSLLPIMESHLTAAPDARYGAMQPVDLRTLDSIVQEWGAQGSIGLKLDVQGYEAEVLAGAEATLPRVAYLEAELSLVHLYEGQPLFADMVERLAALGFSLVNLNPAFVDARSGRTLQLDGVFLREPRRTRANDG
jgi:FkbM family methyltransferase